MENLSGVVLLYKISENLLEPISRSKRPLNFHIFSKISFVHVQFMYLFNLHTTPKGHLIKIEHFFRKTILIKKKYTFARRFEWLKLNQISNSNKTPDISSTYQLKITFKPLNFVGKPFLMCFKIRSPLSLKHLNFRIFSFILHRKYPSNVH